jgi:hypothetical protein
MRVAPIAALIAAILSGCSLFSEAVATDWTSPPRTAEECGFSDSHLDRVSPRQLAEHELDALAAKQPNALAVNPTGESVCAYVHADQFLYLRGSDRALRVGEDGRIEIRFESPVAVIEPVFPEETCGTAQQLERVDRSVWRFKLSPEILSGSCDSVGAGGLPGSFTFSVETEYADTGRFGGQKLGYGVTVEIEGFDKADPA